MGTLFGLASLTIGNVLAYCFFPDSPLAILNVASASFCAGLFAAEVINIFANGEV